MCIIQEFQSEWPDFATFEEDEGIESKNGWHSMRETCHDVGHDGFVDIHPMPKHKATCTCHTVVAMWQKVQLDCSNVDGQQLTSFGKVE